MVCFVFKSSASEMWNKENTRKIWVSPGWWGDLREGCVCVCVSSMSIDSTAIGRFFRSNSSCTILLSIYNWTEVYFDHTAKPLTKGWTCRLFDAAEFYGKFVHVTTISRVLYIFAWQSQTLSVVLQMGHAKRSYSHVNKVPTSYHVNTWLLFSWNVIFFW